jgi:hypothetical protein
LVEGGEVLAACDSAAAAAGKPPWLPDGANHQLPLGVLTEDGEAEPNRPAQQRLVGSEAGMGAAEEPSGEAPGGPSAGGTGAARRR